MESKKQGKPTSWLGGTKGFSDLDNPNRNGGSSNLLWGLVCLMFGAALASVFWMVGVRHGGDSTDGGVNLNMSWQNTLPGGGQPSECDGVDNLIYYLEAQETDGANIMDICEDMSSYSKLFGRELAGCDSVDVKVFWDLFNEACSYMTSEEVTDQQLYNQAEASDLMASLMECDEGCVWANPMHQDTMCETLNSIEWLEKCDECVSDLVLEWQQRCLISESEADLMAEEGMECPGVVLTDWESTPEEYDWTLTQYDCTGFWVDCDDDADPLCLDCLNDDTESCILADVPQRRRAMRKMSMKKMAAKKSMKRMMAAKKKRRRRL